MRGEQLELYDDVERLLPDHIKPQCLEMVMEIEEYDRSTTEKSRENTTQDPSKKRKRNNDPTRDIPPGACTGFVSVAELVEKQKVKKRKKATKFEDTAGLDDETDEEIEAGLFAPRRAASTSATSVKPPKTKLKRAKTTVDGGKKRQTTRKKQTKARVDAESPEPSPSQFLRKGADDSKDMEIERGLWSNSRPSPPKPSPVFKRSPSPDIPLAQNQSIIDICTSAAPSRSPSPKHRYSTPPCLGEVPASQYPSSSPHNSPSAAPLDAVVVPEPSFDDLPPSKGASNQETASMTKECEAVGEDDSLAWLLADSDDAGEAAGSPVAGQCPRMSGSQGSDAIEIEDSEPERSVVLVSSPVRASGPPTSNRDMPPPAIPPLRLRLGSPSPMAPPPSLPVRAAGQAKRRPIIVPVSDSSSPPHPPPLSRKRLYRRRRSHGDDDDDNSPSTRPAISPPKKRKSRTAKRLKVRDTAEAARVIPWIDVEARHSGDEVSSGQSLLGEDEESESEGRFVTDLPATQPPASYDQSAVYRQSLLSQVPAGSSSNRLSVPVFAAPPVRRGGSLRVPPPAGAALPSHHHGRGSRFSSPAAPSDEEDYYMLGSFVVDDEAEISFTQSSEP